MSRYPNPGRTIQHIVLLAALAVAGCGNEAIEWVSSEQVTKATVNHGFRHSSPVDFPELVLSVLMAWDDGWETRSDGPTTVCTVIFEPSDFSRSDVLWIGDGWIGTKSRDQSVYRDLSLEEADLLRVSFDFTAGECGLPNADNPDPDPATGS